MNPSLWLTTQSVAPLPAVHSRRRPSATATRSLRPPGGRPTGSKHPKFELLKDQLLRHAEAGRLSDALSTLDLMADVGAAADLVSFSVLLKSCIRSRDLAGGRSVHRRLLVSGLELDTVVLNSLLTLYAKCGDWPTADSLFRAMGEDKRDLVSWSTMISGAARGENLQPATAAALFCEMLDSGFRPNEFCFSGVLHACANAKLLPFGLAVFGFLTKAGYFAAGVCVGCALIDLFARNLDLRSARKVFDKMPNKNVVAWTQMISRCAQYGSPEEAVELFLEMELAVFSPDQFTLSGVISASTELGWFQLGRQLHARAAQLGLAGDVCVGCSLVDMYAKAPGETAMADSRKVFDRIAENNNVMSWTAIISGHVQRRQDQEALDLFRRMVVHGGSRPNQVTFSGVLRACGNVSDAAAGEQVYAQAVKAGVASINCVGNAFVAVYAKSGRMEEARRALDHLLEKNLISYGDGDSDSGEIGASALTFASLLSAAASVGATSKGRQLHGWLMKVGFCSDQGVCNSLISMYSRCGEVEDACKVFDGLDRRNVISLTAMIGGLAKHGLAERALSLFREMLRGECRPNEVTFIGVLSACAHAGMEEEAWRIFQAMRRDHGIEPRMEHYACMVDLLGRLGFLERAVVFIREMPVKPSALVWRALLGACKIHGDLKLGEEAAVKILQAEPADPAAYVLLSNIYAATGRWRAVAEIRSRMKERRLRKEAGLSWIEVAGGVHEFHAGDTRHRRSGEIYAKLGELAAEIRRVGYVPDLSASLHDVADELKEKHLFQHSEKIAVAFGLISSSSPAQPLRVFKNLRVCGDCHCAIKLISAVTGRTIILRDTNRFHRFEAGVCSCGDYW